MVPIAPMMAIPGPRIALSTSSMGCTIGAKSGAANKYVNICIKITS